MPSEPPRILVLKHPQARWPDAPAMADVWETEHFPAPGELAGREWEYLHPGLDAMVLEGRVYAIAAEYARREKPDLLVMSSPGRRFLAGSHDSRERIFEILCHLAQKNALYAYGNKLFSRSLWDGLPEGPASTRLTHAFRRVRKLTVISHPWVEFSPIDGPSDDEFLQLVECYAGEEKGEAAP